MSFLVSSSFLLRLKRRLRVSFGFPPFPQTLGVDWNVQPSPQARFSKPVIEMRYSNAFDDPPLSEPRTPIDFWGIT
jgi:hypothetical protein